MLIAQCTCKAIEDFARAPRNVTKKAEIILRLDGSFYNFTKLARLNMIWVCAKLKIERAKLIIERSKLIIERVGRRA